MPSPEKEKKIDVLAEYLQEAGAVFVTDFTGMNVELVSELRSRLCKVQGRYRIVKNTLTKLACEKIDRPELGEVFTGPNALVFVEGDDLVAPAKVLVDFIKENELPRLKAGYDGTLRDAKWIEELAKLPPREVLAAQLVSLLVSPIRSLVYCLSGVPRSLVLVLDRAAKKEKETN